MKESEKNLPEAIPKFVTTGKAEHILNILKAGLATAPFCGGIASLISDYIPRGIKGNRPPPISAQPWHHSGRAGVAGAGTPPLNRSSKGRSL